MKIQRGGTLNAGPFLPLSQVFDNLIRLYSLIIIEKPHYPQKHDQYYDLFLPV
jgi:hypothetical protein